MTRMPYEEALALTGALEGLAPFDPHIAGTPPLGIALPSSDIDILCETHDPAIFADHLRDRFGSMAGFSLHLRPELKAVIGRFEAHGWPFEIFGQTMPVIRQQGWRHFLIEKRLLALGGDDLRNRIMVLRRSGLKTEPAFTQALALSGDPYAAILALEGWSDDTLLTLVRARG